jgi:4-oxalocrotonate tautomerase
LELERLRSAEHRIPRESGSGTPTPSSSDNGHCIAQEEEIMPLIQVKAIEGVFTEMQKREIVRKLTDAMVSIEGENMRPVTSVIIEEVKSGSWGIGGKSLTTADVKALAAGQPMG